MVYTGHIRNGVAVFDNAVGLPEGAAVRIEVVEPVPQRTLAERFRSMIATAPDLPEDMARNHDHYIHGAARE